jgi:hypothetical protein
MLLGDCDGPAPSLSLTAAADGNEGGPNRPMAPMVGRGTASRNPSRTSRTMVPPRWQCDGPGVRTAHLLGTKRRTCGDHLHCRIDLCRHQGAARSAARPAALGLLAAQAPASAGAPANLRAGAENRTCLRRGRSGFWDGGHPAHRRPRRSRADLPRGAKVVRPVGRSTLSPRGRPAPRYVGRRRTGWR